MQQITRHPHKRKCAIEQELAAFFRSEGSEIETYSGDVSIYVIVKDSPAADVAGRKVVRVRAKDILLISLSELAHELAGVGR
jgi:hypothetical protein